MDQWAWSQPVSDAVAARRAGGRAKYNAVRQLKAHLRRQALFDLLKQYDGLVFDHGLQSRFAAELGVSRSTVCRDVAQLLKDMQCARVCPLCGCEAQHR